MSKHEFLFFTFQLSNLISFPPYTILIFHVAFPTNLTRLQAELFLKCDKIGFAIFRMGLFRMLMKTRRLGTTDVMHFLTTTRSLML